MQEITNQVMLQNLERVLQKISGTRSQVGAFDVFTQRMMLQRNWGFEFYLEPRILEYARWLEVSDEETNFTYAMKNRHHLAGWVDCVTRCGIARANAVLDEIENDVWLIDYIRAAERQSQSRERYHALGSALYGRRVGWYAIARITRPGLVVETGVDRGLGSVILCRALMLNAEEGFPGVYMGTDINPEAGYLLRDPLTRFGAIHYGDSIETLRKLDRKIDLFINDSDHSAEYEAAEYRTIHRSLAENAVLLGDNSHATSKLYEFAVEHDMSFVHFQEMPQDHWYPGAGIGAAFRRP
ncbi:MAG: class I SAM-dependent methyltransferase [bacterium]|nr:class I SAM-dependent methyltransferase [bacterium]